MNKKEKDNKRINRELLILAVCLLAATGIYLSGVAGNGPGILRISSGIIAGAVVLYLMLGILRLAYLFITNHLNRKTDEENSD